MIIFISLNRRSRPTLKPSGAIVSKATEFVDIYRNPPTRPEPLYPQPIPDKTAAKCRKDVCLLPDCYCGGRDIPGMNSDSVFIVKSQSTLKKKSQSYEWHDSNLIFPIVHIYIFSFVIFKNKFLNQTRFCMTLKKVVF